MEQNNSCPICSFREGLAGPHKVRKAGHRWFGALDYSVMVITIFINELISFCIF